MLANPRYIGRQVWGRQCRDEVLIERSESLVRGLADIVDVLAQADPADKAALYDELGVTMT